MRFKFYCSDVFGLDKPSHVQEKCIIICIIVLSIWSFPSNAYSQLDAQKEDFLTISERLDLFDDLVAAARENHYFSKNVELNLGFQWENELPKLKQEFADASDKYELMNAIKHFQGSLHNVHCRYNVPDRPKTYELPFNVGSELSHDEWRFYIKKLNDQSLNGKIKLGDYIVTVDGISILEFIQMHIHDSWKETRQGVMQDLAYFIAHRSVPPDLPVEGKKSILEFKTRTTGNTYKLSFDWSVEKNKYESWPKYDPNTYKGLEPSKYGSYSIVERGQNFCVLMSNDPKYISYPIIYFQSFSYCGGYEVNNMYTLGMESDYFILKKWVSQSKNIKGLILDLRDNGGGNNPNYFLDWFAPNNYPGEYNSWILSELLYNKRKDSTRPCDVWYDQQYLNKKKEQKLSEKAPFFIYDDPNWDNVYTPKHRIFTYPIAILSGPKCVSSCDSFVLAFKENRFGPIIGEPPASSYSNCSEYSIYTRKNKMYLGTIGFTEFKCTSGVNGEAIEGKLLEPDYPIYETFENKDVYDKLLVDKAIDALKSYKFH